MKKNISVIILAASLWFGGLVSCAYSQAPDLSLEKSMPAAEKALTDAKINLTDYYIYSITFSHSSKGDFWYYTYKSSTNKSEYNQVYIKVYMDKTAEITNSGSSRY